VSYGWWKLIELALVRVAGAEGTVGTVSTVSTAKTKTSGQVLWTTCGRVDDEVAVLGEPKSVVQLIEIGQSN